MAKGVPFANTLVAFRRQAWTEAGDTPWCRISRTCCSLSRWPGSAGSSPRIPEALGEHFVHPASFFHRTFKYAERQRGLARAQSRAIRRLGLPSWMYVFAAGRYAYAYCPTVLKRVMRRVLAGSQERDF